jgi:hypothetical protein
MVAVQRWLSNVAIQLTCFRLRNGLSGYDGRHMASDQFHEGYVQLEECERTWKPTVSRRKPARYPLTAGSCRAAERDSGRFIMENNPALHYVPNAGDEPQCLRCIVVGSAAVSHSRNRVLGHRSQDAKNVHNVKPFTTPASCDGGKDEERASPVCQSGSFASYSICSVIVHSDCARMHTMLTCDVG